MKGRLAMIATALQAGAVVLGFHFGAWIHYPGRPPNIYTVLALLGWFLMLAGAGQSVWNRHVEGARHRIVVTLAVVVYAGCTMLFEPFLEVGPRDLLIAVLVLVPFLLAIGDLVWARELLPLAGVTLFLFTSCAMLSSNARIYDAGSGFFGCWMS